MVWLLVRVCIDNTVGVHCKREDLFHFTSTGAVKATTKSSKDLDYSWMIIGFNSCKDDGEEETSFQDLISMTTIDRDLVLHILETLHNSL